MSQDLFAAFSSLELPASSGPVPQHAEQSSTLRQSRGPRTPLSINSTLRSPPTSTAVSAATTPLPPTEPEVTNDEEDDWGEFEDAAKSSNQPQASKVASDDLDAVLRARLGTPLDAKPDEYFFDTAKRSLPRSVSTAPKSPPPVQSPPPISKALSFKPRPSVERTQQKPTPPRTTNLPFKPKPMEKDTGVGHHPFAGRMDFLFDAADEDEYDAGADDLNVDLARDPEAAMAYSKKLIAKQMAGNGVERGSLPTKTPEPPQKPNVEPTKEAKPQQRSPNKLRKKYAPPKDVDVLFDVEDASATMGDSEDEGWKGFEPQVISPKRPVSTSKPLPKTPAASHEQQMPAIDLLGLDDNMPAAIASPFVDSWEMAPSSQPPQSQSQPTDLEDDNPWSDFATAPPKKSISANADAIPSFSTPMEDPWDDFTAEPPSDRTVETTLSSGLGTFNLLTPPITTLANQPSPPSNLTPPTNIPPPALLLSLLPPLITRTSKPFFESVTHLSAPEKSSTFAQPEVHTVLRGHVALGTVFARLLAGRKLRWKRDKFLAQGMRIGPAGSGGGMKLTGLDKSESAKEDREALDAVSAWATIQARLRSTITAANASSAPPQPKLEMPFEVREVLAVKVLGQDAGGVRARAACGLCGLKREERVQGETGDDVFGEWWVEGWGGHRACWGFWEGIKGDLGGR